MLRMNKILLLGAILGLSSIMMAAFVDHVLAAQLTVKTLHGVHTALRYHQLYSVLIAIIGISLPLLINQRSAIWITRSAYCFILGIVFFSFGIYVSALSGVFSILYLTPFGGILLMLGWVCLLGAACTGNNSLNAQD